MDKKPPHLLPNTTWMVCVCVTGLQRFGIQDPSPSKALLSRVLKVPTQALCHLLLPPNLPAFAVKAVPKHQNAYPNVYCLAPIFSGTGLTGPPTKILPPKPRPIPPPLRTNCAPPIMIAYFYHGNAQPSRGRLAPPAPPCLPGESAPSVEAPAPAHDGREGARLLAASGRGALSHLSPP